jgi:hypothetical protein
MVLSKIHKRKRRRRKSEGEELYRSVAVLATEQMALRNRNQ